MSNKTLNLTADPAYAPIGQIIAELRKSRHKSVTQLAKDAQMIRGSIDGLEASTRRLDVIELCKLADALDVPHTQLFEVITAAYREHSAKRMASQSLP